MKISIEQRQQWRCWGCSRTKIQLREEDRKNKGFLQNNGRQAARRSSSNGLVWNKKKKEHQHQIGFKQEPDKEINPNFCSTETFLRWYKNNGIAESAALEQKAAAKEREFDNKVREPSFKI